MTSTNTLRLTGSQHLQLKEHLFPGDGKEAVALALCGRLVYDGGHTLSVHRLLLVGYDRCRERTVDRITWPTEVGRELFETAAAKSMAIVKIHSHPEGYEQFSELDDTSDIALFQSLHAWTDDGMPHASAVMLPGGEMFGRFIDHAGSFQDLDKIIIAGDDVLIFRRGGTTSVDGAQLRTAQAFGEKTTSLIKELRIGVVGCSGTGSWVIEQLSRLGAGELILADPDIVETKNLNRIVNSSEAHVAENLTKVEAIRATICRHGTGTRVTTFADSLFLPDVARAIAACDIVFGCMDSVEGRDRLNRIAAFYLIPYFDLGVRLDADGAGGIANVSGIVNYLLPDGSSLLSRGAYTSETLRVDALRRTNPTQYKRELDDGYIKGAKVESPAVISVNGFCATMAVNEFLARIHPFRGGRNSDERRQQFDLKNSFWVQRDDVGPCQILSKYVGRGDMFPFLNNVSYD